ncbi:MAG TPA: PKD domain-containing protein [Flavobacteriales bacterium]|nr:PKD domain-containing protein [Flavobacteriales bacterium]
MLRKLLSTLLPLLLFATSAWATHIAGGEIYYQCLGGNQYRITMVVYRDCAGQNLDNSYQLDIQSPCGNKTMTVTSQGGTEISQLCQPQMGNSTCHSGGTLPGMQEYTYTGTVSLPPCNYWNISWTAIYRNGAIANLTNPGNKNIYLEAQINTLDGPCQESPRFTNAAIPYVCSGYPISYSYGAYGPNNDSLTYTFISARNLGGVILPYVAPHTGTEPIPGITLDPQTGQVNFTLNQLGNWVVVVRVDRYNSNGTWIGSVMRDMQFIAYPCTNIPPDPATGTVGGLTGQATQTGPRSIEICESGNFCFDAVIADPNAGDALTITSNIAQNLPGASITTSGSNPLTVHICWTGAPNTSGFFPFIITANDGACPIPALQTYVYSVHVLPGLLTATPDIVDQPCAGNGNGSATVNVNVGTPPFQYNWSNGETTPTMTGPAGNYTLVITDGLGCVAGPLAITIGTTAQPPMANAGPDLVGCTGSLPITLSGSISNAPGGSWSGGNGTFMGSGITVHYMPTPAEIQAGGVDLTLSTAATMCGQAQDVVHVALPNSFAGGTITGTGPGCHGGSTGTATVHFAHTGLSYLWDDPAGQTTATATGLSAGMYSVLVRDAYGCDTTLSITLTQPAALALANLAVVDEQCAGNGDGSITATVTGGTQPYQYAWSNGASTPAISGGAGTYTLNVTDANNCAATQGTATITALGLPNAALAGSDIIACHGSLPVQLQGTVTNASGGTWGGGTGTFSGSGLNVSYMPSAADLIANGVNLVLTTTGNNTCPPATDTVHITLPTSFFGSVAGAVNVGCHGGHTGTATFTPNNPSFSYQWNDPAGQTTAVAMGLAAGNYTLHVTDNYGCDTTVTVTITEPDVLVLGTVQGTAPTCAGGSNGSASVQPTGGTPAYTYQWSANANGQTGPVASNLPPGAYTVTVTDANGCQAQGSVTLAGLPPITLSAQVPDTVCVNTPVNLSAQASGGNGGLTITWDGIGTGTDLTYSFPASQVVQVSVSDQSGCPGPVLQLPVTVLDLSQATLHTYGDTSFCPGGTATVGAWVTGYPGSTSLSWPQIPGTGNGPFTITTSTSRNLTVTVTDGCMNSLQGSINIIVETPPDIILPPVIAQGCAPLTVYFPAGLTNQPVSYLWNLGDGTTSTSMTPVHVYQAGDYTVSLTVTTPLGCSASAQNTGVINAYTPPQAGFTASPWETDADHADIQFTDQSTGALASWQWTFGDGGMSVNPDPHYHYMEPGTWNVVLTVTDDHGCTSSTEHPVKVNPLYDVTIPNAFTPNLNGGGGGGYDPSDLSNDIFYPFIRFVKDFRMRIFNRWGELIFESDDIKRGWDGYYRGELSQQDVYVYQIWVRFVDNKELQRTGDLTLFR